MNETFYVTTPIYYVNDQPHLGHAYTTILADVLAGYQRLRGARVFFLTGVDEHGQKVFNAVRQQGIDDPQAYVDAMAARFERVWAGLNVRYDDFIRTTQPRHTKVVQAVLSDLWRRGEIYRGEYTGWYCVPDERFWTEKDLADAGGSGVCPACARPLERISEANYFFKMSQYQDWLVAHIQANPGFIRPEHRRNEVLGFLRQPLGDLCISRPASRMGWGIALPFDPDYVTYVWFDALLNYVTAAGYLQDDPAHNAGQFEALWPHALHLIGKDILTTHAVYWPAMLKAAGLPLPKTIFAHGWWVVGGQKMGKSLGNAVPPLDLAGVYGVDAFRYFLLRDMTLGQDADFDPQRLSARYHSDLANNLGNLLHRVASMVGRSCGGLLPEGDPSGCQPEVAAAARALRAQAEALPERVLALAGDFAVQQALAAVFELLDAANGFIERTAPWKLAKAGQARELGLVLYSAAEVLRLAGVLLAPVMPERSAELLRRLGWPAPPGGLAALGGSLGWGGLRPGAQVEPGPPLFPRVEA